MRFRLLLSLMLVLGVGSFTPLAAAQAPDRTAPPAAKDAYVNARLAQLFEGAPVRVALRSAFNKWLLVDGSATNGLTAKFSASLFGFTNEAAAREVFQSESRSAISRAVLTNVGYDEFFSDDQGRVIGRRGASVVLLHSAPPGQRDAVLAALSKNLSAHPTLLPDLIPYAHTMHFGDTAPLRAALSKLKVGKVSEMRFSPIPRFGDNAVTAYFDDSDGDELMLTAKAYDSKDAAKAGLEDDQRWVSVRWNEKQVIGGVDVYAYTNYGRADFQVGCYTFVLNTMKRGSDNTQPLLHEVVTALIGEFKR
jgi:hypothetical protein